VQSNSGTWKLGTHKSTESVTTFRGERSPNRRKVLIACWLVGPIAKFSVSVGVYAGKGKGKGKGKGEVPVLLLTEQNARKAYWGNGGISPFIL
jgi:hypothetical protein